MKLESLDDLFVDQLAELYDVERQVADALGRFVHAATSAGLREALERHVEESQEHGRRLERIAQRLPFDRGRRSRAMEGIVREAEILLKGNMDPDVRDASLIAALQKMEHYEIASYGTACTYAKLLGRGEALYLLKATIAEEKYVDETLTEVAEQVNVRAMAHA